jgi:hypothetical protein
MSEEGDHQVRNHVHRHRAPQTTLPPLALLQRVCSCTFDKRCSSSQSSRKFDIVGRTCVQMNTRLSITERTRVLSFKITTCRGDDPKQRDTQSQRRRQTAPQTKEKTQIQTARQAKEKTHAPPKYEGVYERHKWQDQTM